MRQFFLYKKFLLKLIITLSFIGITILAFSLSNYYSKNNKTDEKSEENKQIIDSNNNATLDNNQKDDLISVSMKLIDKNGNVIFDEIKDASDKEVLYDVLVRYHDVRAENSTYGKVIYDIDSVKTKFYSESYISILVNDKYSSFGVSSIYVYDGIKVTFKEVALWQ